MVTLAVAARPAQAQFVPPGEAVIAGEPVRITLPPDAEVLRVVQRPGSPIADTTALSAAGEALTWTPSQAGIVALSAGNIAQTVSVRFDRPPATGIIVLIAAGIILFGGAAFASVKLFGEESPEQVTERPDT